MKTTKIRMDKLNPMIAHILPARTLLQEFCENIPGFASINRFALFESTNEMMEQINPGIA